MLLSELLQDHSVSAARLPHWIVPTDHLLLPPVIDGARGPWATLKTNLGDQKILCIEWGRDVSDEWTPYVPQKDGE